MGSILGALAAALDDDSAALCDGLPPGWGIDGRSCGGVPAPSGFVRQVALR